MTKIRKFKELGVQHVTNGFEGDKIKIDRILNREIVVHDFKIEKSKFADKCDKCLHLQISVDDRKHVVFCTGVALQTILMQIPKDNFPFATTIVKENMRYEFT